MPDTDPVVTRLAVALAIGLLIGIERERSKGDAAAGVRTFTLIALAGAIGTLLGNVAFVAIALVLGAFVTVSYLRSAQEDSGLTTEVAMIVAYLLGGFAIAQPGPAAGLAVVVTIILASRSRLHTWIKHVLTDDEVRDGLILAAAALVILPLLPADAIDPWGIVEPRKLWLLAVLVMAINGLGYIALRILGAQSGLAVAGFFGGFVSSTATIGAMGARTKKHPELHRGAVAGAAASSVATVVQLAIVIGLVSMPMLQVLAPSLAASGVAALAYAAIFTWRSVRESDDRDPPTGRPFDPKTALLFVLVVGLTIVISSALTRWLGDSGLLLATGVSGFADAHAPAISAAALAASEQTTVELGGLAVLVGFTTNAISKSIVAFSVGERRFALELIPGLALMVLSAWLAWFARALLS
jgi:uncharacterized membrane protein (DUF4010 family)